MQMQTCRISESPCVQTSTLTQVLTHLASPLTNTLQPELQAHICLNLNLTQPTPPPPAPCGLKTRVHTVISRYLSAPRMHNFLLLPYTPKHKFLMTRQPTGVPRPPVLQRLYTCQEYMYMYSLRNGRHCVAALITAPYRWRTCQRRQEWCDTD